MDTSSRDGRALRILLTAWGAAVALLHLWGAFDPGSRNWGVHELAFFPAAVGVVIPLLMLAMLLPAVQARCLGMIRGAASWWRRIPRANRITLVVAAVAAAGALLWIARERIFLLGDGALILRMMKNIRDPSQVPQWFTHEPLPGYMVWRSWQYFSLHPELLPAEEFAVQYVTLFFGICAVVLMVLVARALVREGTERVLLLLFILGAGGTELCFAYVENYTPLYAGLLLFIWLSILAVEKGRHAALPSGAFGILFATHFLMLAMLPALGAVWYAAVKRGRARELPSAAFVALAVAGFLLWMCGYTPDAFFTLFLKSGGHLLPLTGADGVQQTYTLFAPVHLAELANLQLLLAPFAAVALVAALIAGPRGMTPRRLFLLAAAAGGVLCTCLINLDLGMSRDWDLLASYTLPLVVAAGAFWLAAPGRERLLVMMAGITLLHTAGWVALNADADRSLARFDLLPDRALWGRKALTGGYEELAIFYRRRVDPASAVKYFRKILAVDSSNGRIWSGLANIYHLTGDTEREIEADERAVALHASTVETYINLSSFYADRNRLDDAQRIAFRALEVDASSAVANNNYGAILLRKETPCREVQHYFVRATELDPAYADAFFNAGLCALDASDTAAARKYLERCLELRIDKEGADAARALLDRIAGMSR